MENKYLCIYVFRFFELVIYIISQSSCVCGSCVIIYWEVLLYLQQKISTLVGSYLAATLSSGRQNVV
jgi:hypothetical protein